MTHEDANHLAELFKRHPSYLTKVGPGVNYFEVMPEAAFIAASQSSPVSAWLDS